MFILGQWNSYFTVDREVRKRDLYLVEYGNLHCPFIVIALDEQYSNYRKFVKWDSVAREVVPLTHSGSNYCKHRKCLLEITLSC